MTVHTSLQHLLTYWATPAHSIAGLSNANNFNYYTNIKDNSLENHFVLLLDLA